MTYKRPDLNLETFVDDAGAPIPYGRRWGMGPPREDTYSVTAHPQRFAPLLEVGRALRAHLIETYDVEVDGDTIVPRRLGAASLTITHTDFPQVQARAGAFGLTRGPHCGCDACDEDVAELAGDLEHFVFAVVGGRFWETIAGSVVTAGWEYPGGGRSSSTPRKELSQAQAALLRARGKDAHWLPWSLRA